MKAKLHHRVKTLIEVNGHFSPHPVVVKGSVGNVVECFENPESYFVELEIPDDTETLPTGISFEMVVLYPEQFEVTSSSN